MANFLLLCSYSCPPSYTVSNFHAENPGVNKRDGEWFGKDNGLCNAKIKVFKADGITSDELDNPTCSTFLKGCSRDVRLVCSII
jgi:hypothetical protein